MKQTDYAALAHSGNSIGSYPITHGKMVKVLISKRIMQMMLRMAPERRRLLVVNVLEV